MQSEKNPNKHFRAVEDGAVRTGFEKDSPKAVPDKLPKGKTIEVTSAMVLPGIAGQKDPYLRMEFKGGKPATSAFWRAFTACTLLSLCARFLSF
eukprot:SAG22_NODE_1902_length_3339_cov_2.045370_3_plen_94_part_00